MSLERYGQLLADQPQNKEELIKHFANKIYYFIIDNDINDGPGLDDLLEEFIDCYDQMKPND